MLAVGTTFVGLLFLGLPVFVCLLAASILGLVLLQDIPLAVIAAKTASTTDSFVLLAIPLFMLAGSLMSHGGVAGRLFDLARVLVGHFTGGLAQINILLSTMYGGISGSSAADAALDSKLVVPQMRADGYPAAFSGAITAAAAMLANIIPPSIAMLVYAAIANVSVGRLFIAGIIPGLMMAGSLSITAYRTCRKMGYGTPKPRATREQVWHAFKRAFTALSLPVVVVGGIRFGYFTPTESGAIAVVVALVLGLFVYRELDPRALPGIVARTAVDTGVIMLIISFSAPVSLVFAYNQAPQHLAAFFASFSSSHALFLLAVNVLLLIGGCFLEGVTLLVLTTPLLAPAAASLGIDPIHFGMVVVFNVVLGSITPPFGQLVFMVSSLTRTPPEDIFAQVLRYLPLLFAVLGVVTYVPETFMWTVRLFGP